MAAAVWQDIAAGASYANFSEDNLYSSGTRTALPQRGQPLSGKYHDLIPYLDILIILNHFALQKAIYLVGIHIILPYACLLPTPGL